MAPSVDVTWKAAWSLVLLCQKDVTLHQRTHLGLEAFGPRQPHCQISQTALVLGLAVGLVVGGKVTIRHQLTATSYDVREYAGCRLTARFVLVLCPSSS